MNNGKIIFTRPGSDEVVGEVPFSASISNLARVRLAKAKNRSFEGDKEAAGFYAIFMAAEIAGVEGVSLPTPADVDPEAVYELCVAYDVKFSGTPLDVPEDEGDGGDGNPTDSRGASS